MALLLFPMIIGVLLTGLILLVQKECDTSISGKAQLVNPNFYKKFPPLTSQENVIQLTFSPKNSNLIVLFVLSEIYLSHSCLLHLCFRLLACIRGVRIFGIIKIKFEISKFQTMSKASHFVLHFSIC